MNIAVVGTDEIGLSTAILLAYLNHFVILVDDNQAKIDLLKNNSLHYFEPNLNDILKLASNKLYFTTNLTQAIEAVDMVFYTSNPGYSAMEVCQILTDCLKTKHRVIVNKSADELGITSKMERAINERTSNFSMVFEAPYARPGTLVYDTFFPDKIVLGAHDMVASQQLRTLYEPLFEDALILPEFVKKPHNVSSQLIITDVDSAEAAFHVEKVFQAVKLNLLNEVSNLTEHFNAKPDEVLRVLRVGESLNNLNLRQGLGWTSREYGRNFEVLTEAAEITNTDIPIIRSSLVSNYNQRDYVLKKLGDRLGGFDGKTIGILGISYKPFTDDLSDSAAVDIIQRLVCFNAIIKAHDPICNFKMSMKFPDLPVQYCDDDMSVFYGADAVILCTEWPEYFEIDWFQYAEIMQQRIVFDAQNSLPPEDFKNMKIELLRFGDNSQT